MNLYNLLQENSSLNVTINAGQLVEAIDYAVGKTKAEFETKEQPEQYQQVAQKLAVDLSTLWRWSKEGYLQAIPIGGKRRYKLSDVERILQKKA